MCGTQPSSELRETVLLWLFSGRCGQHVLFCFVCNVDYRPADRLDNNCPEKTLHLGIGLCSLLCSEGSEVL